MAGPEHVVAHCRAWILERCSCKPQLLLQLLIQRHIICCWLAFAGWAWPFLLLKLSLVQEHFQLLQQGKTLIRVYSIEPGSYK